MFSEDVYNLVCLKKDGMARHWTMPFLYQRGVLKPKRVPIVLTHNESYQKHSMEGAETCQN